jgi:uncharacterized membrane protein
MTALGIIFSLGALLFWGFGDFFIQRTARKTGIINALFYITGLAAIILLPFVWNELPELVNYPKLLILLLLSGVIVFLAAAVQFEALKEGKLSVVEPIVSFELPLTVLLGVSLRGENISAAEGLLIFIVFIGILLSITTHRLQLHYHRRLFEKGVLFAALGAIGMALTNFFIGYSSQETSPLLTIWFTHTVIAVLCLGYLIFKQKTRMLWTDLKLYFRPIAFESVFDNLAWISYAYAVVYVPISIAITISESYIILAVILGIIFNGERLKHHQRVGVGLAVIGVIILSAISH